MLQRLANHLRNQELWCYVALVPLPILIAVVLLSSASAPAAESLPVPVEVSAAPLEPTTSTTTSTTAAPLQPVAASTKPSRRTVPHALVTTSTTSTTAPAKARTLLELAQAEVGKAGPYAYDKSWCAQFVTWVAEQSGTPFRGDDSPARLHVRAEADGRLSPTPIVGGLVFIDLLGQGNPNDYVTHVGIVESVDGDQILTIEGNAAPDRDVVTRHTRTLGDGFVVAFASFDGSVQ